MNLIFIELVTLPMKIGFRKMATTKNYTKLKALRIMSCNIGNVQNIKNISKNTINIVFQVLNTKSNSKIHYEK